MRKLNIILSVGAISTCLVACYYEPVRKAKASSERAFEDRQSLRGAILLVDPETGCEYLSFGSGTLTPRLGPDAIPNCRDTIAPRDVER